MRIIDSLNRPFSYNRSPSGGWWSRPKTWKSNTAVAAIGMGVTLAAIWKVSADREWRHREPTRWIPSMMVRRLFCMVWQKAL
jgi:hypothetical protein